MKIYRVEKFIPTACPNPRCFNPFIKNNEEGYLLGTYWMHESRERVEAILASISHSALKTDLIVCGKCHNLVMRVMIEERNHKTREEAQKAINGEGFVNLQEIDATGPLIPQKIVCLKEVDDPLIKTMILFR